MTGGTHTTHTFWVSFAGDTWRGFMLVDARDHASALKKAQASPENPGGEIAGWQIPDDVANVRVRNWARQAKRLHLYTRETAPAFLGLERVEKANDAVAGRAAVICEVLLKVG